MESKKNPHRNSRLVMGDWWEKGMSEDSQRVETSNYKMNTLWGSNVQLGEYSEEHYFVYSCWMWNLHHTRKNGNYMRW